MKKLVFLLLSAAVAVSAMAGINGTKATMPKHLTPVSQKMNPVTMDYTIQQTHQFNLQTMFKANRAAEDLITEQPEGDARLYTRTGTCIYYSSKLYYGDQDGIETTIVYAADGETIYMLNPVSKFEGGTWVRGTISGNKITIPLGQFVSWNSTYSYGLILAWGTFVNGTGYTTDSSVTEATFTISGNTITMDNTSDDGTNMTGLSLIWSDDSSWQGFLDMNTVLTSEGQSYPVPTDLTVVPAATTANVTWVDNNAGGWNLRWRPVVDMTNAPAYWDWNDTDMDALMDQYYGWGTIDLDDDGNDWEIALWTQDEETGEYDAGWMSYSYNNDSGETYEPDNWLITPIVPLGGVVRFHAYGHPSYPETFAVLVADENAETTADFVSISGDIQTQGVPDGGYEYVFDLSEYEGTNGMIAFRHYNCTDCYFIFLTDVFVGPADAEIVKPAKWTVVEGLTEPEYDIVGLTPETEYEVAVQGVDDGGKSDWTEAVDFWTTALIPDLYILGEVFDQTWDPTAGYKMDYNAEDNLYTATVTFDGRGESGENYFSFTTELAENNDDGGWAYIEPFRYGAVTENNSDFWYDDMYDGQPLDIQQGKAAFRIMNGQYNITVDLANLKVIIERAGLRGDVNKDGVIDIADVTALISHVLSKNYTETDSFSPGNADVNDDGEWTIADVTMLINRVLKKTW